MCANCHFKWRPVQRWVPVQQTSDEVKVSSVFLNNLNAHPVYPNSSWGSHHFTGRRLPGPFEPDSQCRGRAPRRYNFTSMTESGACGYVVLTNMPRSEKLLEIPAWRTPSNANSTLQRLMNLLCFLLLATAGTSLWQRGNQEKIGLFTLPSFLSCYETDHKLCVNLVEFNYGPRQTRDEAINCR